MHYSIRKPWDLPQSRHTPREVYQNRAMHRRAFLRTLGCAGAGAGLALGLAGCEGPSLTEIEQAGASAASVPEGLRKLYPAKRNPEFAYRRDETPKKETLQYTNFYEFSTRKDSWKLVGQFKPDPWTVEVTGLCAKPRTFDLDDIHRLMKLEERCYHHRCVETWAMCVPWTGFPLADLLKAVEPSPRARYVSFESFYRPDEAPGIPKNPNFSWPYTEGLTLDEATNELSILATGLYGEPLAKQNGAPIRLVVPWKYGFKCIKSITRIQLLDRRPATFWNTEWPAAYDFTANVDPNVSHPSWSQSTEWMLGTRERFETKLYNGYGEYVAKIYDA